MTRDILVDVVSRHATSEGVVSYLRDLDGCLHVVIDTVEGGRSTLRRIATGCRAAPGRVASW